MAKTKAGSATKSKIDSGASKEVMSVAEIERLYPNEYVIMEITRRATRHESIRGRVIDHGPVAEADAIVARNRGFHLKHPGVPILLLYTTRDAPHPGVSIVI